MKTWPFILAFLVVTVLGAICASEAYAQTTDVVTYTTNVSTAPTLATDGASLKDATGFSVVMSAPSGEYFDGTASSALCYYFGPVDGSGTFRWMRCKSTLDIAAAPFGIVRDIPSSEFAVLVGYGRVKYVPSGLDAGVANIRFTIAVRRR